MPEEDVAVLTRHLLGKEPSHRAAMSWVYRSGHLRADYEGSRRHRNPMGYGAAQSTTTAAPPTIAGIRIPFLTPPCFRMRVTEAYWTVVSGPFFCRRRKASLSTCTMRPFRVFPVDRLTITGSALMFQSRACSLSVEAEGSGAWASAGLAVVMIHSAARISAVNGWSFQFLIALFVLSISGSRQRFGS